MSTLRFTKMHALGNDFVAVNGFAPLPVPETGFPELAIRLCDRHFGIGADGLFVAMPSEGADARMLFYNPDGTPDRCGNGLRCFGRFLHDEGITDRRRLRVETYGGPVDLCVETDGARVGSVRVDLGPPVLRPADIPMDWPGEQALDVPVEVAGRAYRLHAVSTGTPHAVIFVDALPDEETFQEVSPLLENHPLFPEKTSVMWTHFTGPDAAEIRIWERATGETLGCGTGAAAIAVLARLLGRAPDGVRVRSRGGEVLAAWDGRDSVTLTGPAHVVYQGEWTGTLSGL